MTLTLAAFLIAVASDMPPPGVAPIPAQPKEDVLEDIPEELRIGVLGCDIFMVCAVPISEIAKHTRAHFNTAKKLKELETSKGCAKVEVLPKTPKLKKERDT